MLMQLRAVSIQEDETNKTEDPTHTMILVLIEVPQNIFLISQDYHKGFKKAL